MLLIREDMAPEEYLAYAEQHPDTHFDFMDGELVEAIQKPVQGRFQARMAYSLETWLRSSPFSATLVTHIEVLHVLDGMKFQPDVSINPPSEADYFTEPPLVAVEIRSDSQSRESQRRKARAYIQHGAKMVILAFPREHIETYLPGRDPLVLTADDTINGGDALPGFRLPVREVLGP